jgi:lysozyme family protein
MADFVKALPRVFKFEGGFQNYANDNANYCDGKLIGTNMGISSVAYKTAYGVCPTFEQIKSLTRSQAEQIYKKNYWDKINGDKIKNQSVAELMFQFIIGSGASQISILKDIANDVNGKNIIVSDDSVITDGEASLINALNQEKYHSALKLWRENFLKGLAEKNPDKYGMFLNGWLRRLASYIYFPEITEEKKK